MPVLCSLRYCTSQKEHSTGIQPLETDSVTGDICVQRYASLTLKCLIVIAGSVTQVLLAGTSASFGSNPIQSMELLSCRLLIWQFWQRACFRVTLLPLVCQCTVHESLAHIRCTRVAAESL